MTLTKPWPGMLRGIWGDDERYKETYWNRFGDQYFAGDGARIDEDGYFWFMGRVDDVMNVAGHRISTAEVESALVDHPAVAEAAVVAKADPETGQAISAFVTLRAGYEESTELIVELRNHVGKLIGAIAKPKWIAFTPDLPKTRSGKIMRRLLRDIAENRKLGDTTTLADSSIVADLQRRATEEESQGTVDPSQWGTDRFEHAPECDSLRAHWRATNLWQLQLHPPPPALRRRWHRSQTQLRSG